MDLEAQELWVPSYLCHFVLAFWSLRYSLNVHSLWVIWVIWDLVALVQIFLAYGKNSKLV